MAKPNYYAILTAGVRYDEKLTPSEKILYAEITALTNKNGYCHASNDYFAKLYKVNKGTVSRWISHLNKRGYIDVGIKRDERKVIVSRTITLTDKTSTPYTHKKSKGIDDIVKESTTRTNTTRTNINSEKKYLCKDEVLKTSSLVKKKSLPTKDEAKKYFIDYATKYHKENNPAKYTIDTEKLQLKFTEFWEYYQDKNWENIEDWKLKVRTWVRRMFGSNQNCLKPYKQQNRNTKFVEFKF